MSAFVFANNVNTTLSSAISPTDTTIVLASSANLPTIPTGSYFAVTLNDAATRSVFEVMYATAVSGANLTVIRGQEGTGAQSWGVGDYVYATDTAGTLANMGQLGSANTWTGANDFTSTVTVADGTSGNEAVNISQFPSSLEQSGYKKYPDPNAPGGHFIEQWGAYLTSQNPKETIDFPVEFSTAILSGFATEQNATDATWGIGAPDISAPDNSTWTVSGMTIYSLHWIPASTGWVGQDSLGIGWMAKGY